LYENSASVLKTLDNLIALHASHKATLKTKQEWVVPPQRAFLQKPAIGN
jgi:hypothetical protein